MTEKRIWPVWRAVKARAPHCPKCKERLFGDNSLGMPYRCSCGVWQSNWREPGYVIIKPEIYAKRLKRFMED